MYYYKNNKYYSITNLLILINTVYFIFLDLSGITASTDKMLLYGAADARLIFYEQQYYRLLSATFMHFDIMHISGNMLILFLLGNKLEKILGAAKYLSLYIAASVFSSVFSEIHAIYAGEFLVGAGASGAVFAVLGAIIYILYAGEVIEDLNVKNMLLMALIMIAYGFMSENVDNVAHIAGAVLGFLMSMVLYRKEDY